MHRDLKPENVVFFEKLGTVKLTDFGFSNRFCPGQKLETSCGSLAYSAPEILLGDSYDAPAVGMYSCNWFVYTVNFVSNIVLILLNGVNWLTSKKSLNLIVQYLVVEHVDKKC